MSVVISTTRHSHTRPSSSSSITGLCHSRVHTLTLSDGPDPHVEGAKGGNTGGEQYKPSEHGGLKKDGTEDKRTRSDHGFGGS